MASRVGGGIEIRGLLLRTSVGLPDLADMKSDVVGDAIRRRSGDIGEDVLPIAGDPVETATLPLGEIAVPGRTLTLS